MPDTMQRFKTLFAGSGVDYVECEVVNATQRYLQLREQGKREGFTPVIVTLDDLILDEITEGLENAGVQTVPELVQRTMEAAQAIDVPAFLLTSRRSCQLKQRKRLSALLLWMTILRRASQCHRERATSLQSTSSARSRQIATIRLLLSNYQPLRRMKH